MRALRWAAVLYGVAWVVHTGDHLRRGIGSTTGQVFWAGTFAAVFQVVAIALVFATWRHAPVLAAAVGIPDALGIFAVHLLPTWSTALSDSFPDAHGGGVTGFSWFAAVLEIAGALAFGVAGLLAWRSSAREGPAGAVVA